MDNNSAIITFICAKHKTDNYIILLPESIVIIPTHYNIFILTPRELDDFKIASSFVIIVLLRDVKSNISAKLGNMTIQSSYNMYINA